MTPSSQDSTEDGRKQVTLRYLEINFGTRSGLDKLAVQAFRALAGLTGSV